MKSNGAGCPTRGYGNTAKRFPLAAVQIVRVEDTQLRCSRRREDQQRTPASLRPYRNVSSQISASVTLREKYAVRPLRVSRGGPITSRDTSKIFRTCFVRLSTM